MELKPARLKPHHNDGRGSATNSGGNPGGIPTTPKRCSGDATPTPRTPGGEWNGRIDSTPYSA